MGLIRLHIQRYQAIMQMTAKTQIGVRTYAVKNKFGNGHTEMETAFIKEILGTRLVYQTTY